MILRYIKMMFILSIFFGIMTYSIYKNYVFISTYEGSQIVMTSMPEDLMSLDMKHFIYNYLHDLIHSDWFINKYGRSKLNPIFLHRYYTTIICNPDYIIDFLEKPEINKLLLNEINNKNDAFNVFLVKIFCAYVEESINSVERKVRNSVDILLGIKTMISLQNVMRGIVEWHNISVANIVTPGAQENMIFTKKKLVQLAISGLVLVTMYITRLL